MLHLTELPPSIIPWGTNSCSLPPCSSMHRCQACQDTTTPQLRQAGKAKATRGRMRNLSIWDLQLEIQTLHFESVLGLIESSLAVVQAMRNT